MASGQRYAADASIIAAPKADWGPEAIDSNEAPRAVREYFETLDEAAFGAAPVDFTMNSSSQQPLKTSKSSQN